MEKNTETEQIKDFMNRVEINGTLVSMEVDEKVSQNTGIPYIRVRGEIQYGKTGIETEKFTSFALAQKKDGGENKKYKNLKNFVETAIPMTKDKENATKIKLTCNFEANDFWSDREEKVIENIQNNLNFLGDYDPAYTEAQGNLTNLTANVDGYILGITDEIKNNEPTGRKKLNLLTLDGFKNPVIIKNIAVESDIANDLETSYSKGDTARFYLVRVVHKGTTHAPSEGGFGIKRVTEGKDYTEWRCIGGDEPYDEDSKKVITPKIYKELMTIRENSLAEIKAAGESGERKSNTSKSGFGTKKAATMATPISDEDIPF